MLPRYNIQFLDISPALLTVDNSTVKQSGVSGTLSVWCLEPAVMLAATVGSVPSWSAQWVQCMYLKTKYHKQTNKQNKTKQTNKHTNKHTNTQTNTPTDRQTDRHTNMMIHESFMKHPWIIHASFMNHVFFPRGSCVLYSAEGPNSCQVAIRPAILSGRFPWALSQPSAQQKFDKNGAPGGLSSRDLQEKRGCCRGVVSWFLLQLLRGTSAESWLKVENIMLGPMPSIRMNHVSWYHWFGADHLRFKVSQSRVEKSIGLSGLSNKGLGGFSLKWNFAEDQILIWICLPTSFQNSPGGAL